MSSRLTITVFPSARACFRAQVVLPLAGIPTVRVTVLIDSPSSSVLLGRRSTRPYDGEPFRNQQSCALAPGTTETCRLGLRSYENPPLPVPDQPSDILRRYESLVCLRLAVRQCYRIDRRAVND